MSSARQTLQGYGKILVSPEEPREQNYTEKWLQEQRFREGSRNFENTSPRPRLASPASPTSTDLEGREAKGPVIRKRRQRRPGRITKKVTKTASQCPRGTRTSRNITQTTDKFISRAMGKLWQDQRKTKGKP